MEIFRLLITKSIGFALLVINYFYFIGFITGAKCGAESPKKESTNDFGYVDYFAI